MENIIANPQQIQSVVDCIKSTSKLLGTQYTNICDGTSYFVALGFWDYIGITMLCLLGFMFLFVLIGFFYRLIFD
jgi:hypothetical protein